MRAGRMDRQYPGGAAVDVSRRPARLRLRRFPWRVAWRAGRSGAPAVPAGSGPQLEVQVTAAGASGLADFADAVARQHSVTGLDDRGSAHMHVCGRAAVSVLDHDVVAGAGVECGLDDAAGHGCHQWSAAGREHVLPLVPATPAKAAGRRAELVRTDDREDRWSSGIRVGLGHGAGGDPDRGDARRPRPAVHLDGSATSRLGTTIDSASGAAARGRTTRSSARPGPPTKCTRSTPLRFSPTIFSRAPLVHSLVRPSEQTTAEINGRPGACVPPDPGDWAPARAGVARLMRVASTAIRRTGTPSSSRLRGELTGSR